MNEWMPDWINNIVFRWVYELENNSQNSLQKSTVIFFYTIFCKCDLYDYSEAFH